jgi:hypothetical protein
MLFQIVSRLARINFAMRTIYVYLTGEGTDVWRPVSGRHVDADIFEIVSENSAREDECWEFNRGQKVRCKERITPEGEKILVAYELFLN